MDEFSPQEKRYKSNSLKIFEKEQKKRKMIKVVFVLEQQMKKKSLLTAQSFLFTPY